MMRQIILDTETTGLSPAEGHRVIEIGCVELIDRRYTGNHFHYYFNPERKVDAGALAVHGISDEFLSSQPFFRDLVERFLEFVQGAELVIHNAAFDVAFLNYELQLTKKNFKTIAEYCSVLDTLALARQKHPGQQNSLDALCRRYQVDNSNRELHGALLDARLLAEVYLAMTGGQSSLFVEEQQIKPDTYAAEINFIKIDQPLLIIYPDEQEQQEHQKRLQELKKKSGKTLWLDE